MTREDIEKLPSIVDALLDESVITDTKENLGKRLNEVCELAIKALEQESVLDKIRTEIKEKFEGCDICEWFDDYDYEENDISEYRALGDIEDILQIIDYYMAESEERV